MKSKNSGCALKHSLSASTGSSAVRLLKFTYMLVTCFLDQLAQPDLSFNIFQQRLDSKKNVGGETPREYISRGIFSQHHHHKLEISDTANMLRCNARSKYFNSEYFILALICQHRPSPSATCCLTLKMFLCCSRAVLPGVHTLSSLHSIISPW